MDRLAATMPSQAHAGAAQEAPDIGQWEGQDVPLVRPSSCNVKGGIPSSRRYLLTYLNHLFAKIQFNNLTFNSLRLSPFEIDEGRTPHFPLDFPRMTSPAHDPSTVNDYMQRAERTFNSVRAMLAEERRRQMHVVLQMDRHVLVPEVDDGGC